MRLGTREWLQDALAHLETLRRYLAEDHGDAEMILDAAALRLSAAIESVSHVPDAHRRDVITDQSWRQIKGVRNRIAHSYGFVDREMLWDILAEDVADFENGVRVLLDREAE